MTLYSKLGEIEDFTRQLSGDVNPPSDPENDVFMIDESFGEDIKPFNPV